MDKQVHGMDVATVLRNLAEAIESGKAQNASASCAMEMASVVQQVGLGTVVAVGEAPTGNVIMTVHFRPMK